VATHFAPGSLATHLAPRSVATHLLAAALANAQHRQQVSFIVSAAISLPSRLAKGTRWRWAVSFTLQPL